MSDPALPANPFDLARSHIERGKLDEALAIYRRVAESTPHLLPYPGDRYQIERVLGAGGFSTVFLCQDTSSETPVVIKAIDAVLPNGQRIEPFHEATLLAELNHPSIVKLLGQGYADPASRQRPFLLLEYLPGITLHDYVARFGPLSWQNWLPISRQILIAIQAVHDAGIVHRDVKPGNLVMQLTATGWQVKLIDFGIAVRQPMLAGTIGFAPPEQLNRDLELGAPLDIYAFGRTARYALSGQPDAEASQFEFVPPPLAQLLSACQSTQPSARPTLQKLILSIDGLLARGWSAKYSLDTPVPALEHTDRSVPVEPVASNPAAKTWIYDDRGNVMNETSQPNLQRALVVESNPQDRDRLAELLHELGLEVEFARGYPTGISAFRAASEVGKHFSFVFVSAQLHSNSAFELVRLIRSDSFRVQIVLTDDPDPTLANQVQDAWEIRHYDLKIVTKPFELSALRRVVQPQASAVVCESSAPYSEPDDFPSPAPRAAPITTLSGPSSSGPSSSVPPSSGPGGFSPAPKTDVVSPESYLPAAHPQPATDIPAAEPRAKAPASRSSGELAMRGGYDEPLSPYEYLYPATPIPPRPLPTSSSAPAQPAPPAPAREPDLANRHTPGAGQGSSDLTEAVASVWESIQQTMRGWFKKKPAEERLNDLGRVKPIESWAKPSSPGHVEPSTRFPRVEPSEDASAQPLVEVPRDEVDCTVYAPPEIAAGNTVLIQAMLHLPEEAQLAAALAQQYDDTALPRGARSLDTKIERGARLAFQLTLPGLEIDDPTPPAVVWRGRPEGVQFGVTAPTDSPARSVIGTVLVTLESVPIGQIKFKLDIKAKAAASILPLVQQSLKTTVESPSLPHKMTRYQMVFISYASPDRDEVLKRVQMLKRFHVKFFQDVLNLEPGERWEQSLYKHIDQSDLFLLFWSTAAKNSKWVREEVKYALERRGGSDGECPEIVPIVLEGPPVPEPLPELAHLHFNDQILHFVADRYSSAAP